MPIRSKTKHPSLNRFSYVLDRAFFNVLTVMVFLTPLVFLPGLTDYNYAKTIASLVLISVLLILWSATAWAKPEWELRIPGLLFGGIGLLFTGALSLIHASLPPIVTQSLILFILFVLLLWMVADRVRNHQDVQRLLGALLASLSLASLYAVLQYFGILTGPGGVDGGIGAMISTLGNRNHLGGLILYAFFPSVILLLKARRPWQKALVLAAMVGNYTVMWLIEQTATRIAFVLVATALGVGWLIFRPKISRRSDRWWLVALACFVIIIPILFLTNSEGGGTSLQEVWERNSGDVRAWDWWIAVDMVRDRPVTGAGLGHFKIEFLDSKLDVLASERGENFDFYMPPSDQAHNEYIQVAAEQGSLGVVIMFATLGLLALSLWIRLKRADSEHRADLLLLTLGILAFLVHSLVSFPVHVVSSSLALVVITGIALSAPYGESLTLHSTLRSWKAKGTHLLIAAIAIAISVFALSDGRANWLMERGIDHIRKAEYPEAENLLLKSLQLDFFPRQTYYYLAVAQTQIGNLLGAERNFERGVPRFRNAEVLLQYASLLIRTGQFSNAATLLETILASNPKDSTARSAMHLRAQVQSQSGDLADAIETLDTLIATYPSYFNAYVDLAGIYVRLSRPDDARTQYFHALAIVEQRIADVQDEINAENQTMSADRFFVLRNELEALMNEASRIESLLSSLSSPAP